MGFLTSQRRKATDELVATTEDISLSVPFGNHNDGDERGGNSTDVALHIKIHPAHCYSYCKIISKMHTANCYSYCKIITKLHTANKNCYGYCKIISKTAYCKFLLMQSVVVTASPDQICILQIASEIHEVL